MPLALQLWTVRDDLAADTAGTLSRVADLGAILAAGAGHVRWHIVELDTCATDVYEAARQSGDWLAENGWSSWR